MIKFKILDITEDIEREKLIVKVETPYKIYDWKFPINSKFINLQTNKPEFLHLIKERLEKKFKKLPTPNTEMKQWIGEYQTTDIEDLSPKGLNAKVIIRREKKEKGLPQKKDKE